MKEQCTDNGYTPFENQVQEAIKDLVPLVTAQTISTRIGTLHRAAKAVGGESTDHAIADICRQMSKDICELFGKKDEEQKLIKVFQYIYNVTTKGALRDLPLYQEAAQPSNGVGLLPGEPPSVKTNQRCKHCDTLITFVEYESDMPPLTNGDTFSCGSCDGINTIKSALTRTGGGENV